MLIPSSLHKNISIIIQQFCPSVDIFLGEGSRQCFAMQQFFSVGKQSNSASLICIIATDNWFGQAFVGVAEKSNSAYFEVLPVLLCSKAEHMKLC